MRIFFLFILSIVCVSLKAQTAYHGGAGDGYAKTEITGVTVGGLSEIEEPITVRFVNLVVRNQKVTFVSSQKASKILIYDQKGNLQAQVHDGTWQADLSAGVYLIRFYFEETVLVKKIVIIE